MASLMALLRRLLVMAAPTPNLKPNSFSSASCRTNSSPMRAIRSGSPILFGRED